MIRNGARLAAVLIGCVAGAWGQPNQREPHIGYIYPAGGRQGTTFLVTIGGQFLRNAEHVYVTGEGVSATVIRHYPPLANIKPEQRELLASRLRELFRQRWEELVRQGKVESGSAWEQLMGRGPGRGRAARKKEEAAEAVELPEHPLLYDLDRKSLRELLHVVHAFRNLRKGQRNAQLAEMVLLEVTIDREAQPGDRELRVGTRQGLTNPLVFQVGTLPEAHELEVENPRVLKLLPEEPPLKTPIVINGQIMPGDADRFRFSAQAGDGLVVEVCARQLIPYLADAVPGWFQAVVALYDRDGRELAFADDYRFNPDPVLFYEVPEDGEYELEIRDSIYRGREDFVYRISVGKRPFVTSIFPLGCRAGQKRYVTVAGWNLHTDRLFLDAHPKQGRGIYRKALGHGRGIANSITYAVDELHAVVESEDNDSMPHAQLVRLPQIIDGRIARPGDIDCFQFEGRAGAEIVVEVSARRLGSPLDSLVRLFDSSGRVLAWNDDCEHKEGYLYTDTGTITHHADSYVRAQLPADGTCYVQLSDAQGQGGEAWAYRLRISAPQPDFELRLTPSSLNMRAGLAAVVHVYALRRDGFDGPIELALKDAPAGFSLAGARIPPGRDAVRMTLSAPAEPVAEPVCLELEGHAIIDGRTVTRRVAPAEDMMQAFLYRHLTPSQELMVAVLGGRRGPPIRLAGSGPVRIPAGGVAQARLVIPPNPRLRDIKLELSDPPAGITLRKTAQTAEGLTLELAADADAAPVGFADNLIVEAALEIERKPRGGQAAGRKQRVALGPLPAIPIEVVQQ